MSNAVQMDHVPKMNLRLYPVITINYHTHTPATTMSHYERLVHDMLGAEDNLLRDSRRRRFGSMRFSPLAPERAQWFGGERTAMLDDYRSLEDEALAVGTMLEELDGKETVSFAEFSAASEIARLFQQRCIDRTCRYSIYRQWFTHAHVQAQERLSICSDAVAAYVSRVMRRTI